MIVADELQDKDVQEFLEHYGKKGMHWGVRGTKRAQKHIDRLDRISKGTASKKDRLLGANRYVFTKKGAARQLQRGANRQAKIKSGKMKTTNILSTVGGVKVKNLDFHRKGDAKAKMDNGQKVAIAGLAAYGAVMLVSTAAARKM